MQAGGPPWQQGRRQDEYAWASCPPGGSAQERKAPPAYLRVTREEALLAVADSWVGESAVGLAQSRRRTATTLP
jgi:hypothetical protein